MLFAHLKVKPTLVDQIKRTYIDNLSLMIVDEVRNGDRTDFSFYADGTLRFGSRLCIPNVRKLERKILDKAHKTAYIVHPSSTKMYKGLKGTYW